MNCERAQMLLNDFVDGVLSHDENRQLEAHLSGCDKCRDQLRRLQAVLHKAAHLPKTIEPPRDLWPEIEGRIREQSTSKFWQWNLLRYRAGGAAKSLSDLDKMNGHYVPAPRGRAAQFMIAALLVCMVVGMWFYWQTQKSSWEVMCLSGSLKVGSDPVDQTGRWAVGEWLETDDVSRAQINVGMIGRLNVEPNTRIRLLQARLTDHRLDLARGTIHATIWAPPRLFFVETVAAVAVDLGCEYTLHIEDNGSGLLHVTAGYVALESHGRESVVPAGALCAMRPGVGPGTPYAEDASQPLREALTKLDFQNGGADELDTIFRDARFADTFTLWHLLVRVEPALRPRVYDRMTELISPPEGVTRDGVLRGDKKMLDKWAETFGLGFSWWRYWLPL